MAADMGNAHSEYLGPLSESGILGALSFLILIVIVCIRALKVYRCLSDKELKIFLLTIFLGLVTYFLHGFFNNFLIAASFHHLDLLDFIHWNL